MAFAWEKRVQRFRNTETGRFVPYRTIRRGVDAVADASSRNMVAATAHLREGTISVLDWEKSMRDAIKLNELAQTMAAHGGRAAMDQSTFGFAGQRIREQYRYLQQFAADIVSGRQPLNGRMITRASMYGAHGRATFEAVRARDLEANAAERGIVMEEINRLGSGDPCTECPALSDRGWVPIGTLPPVGSRSCLSNCRCRVERRRVRARVLAETA